MENSSISQTWGQIIIGAIITGFISVIAIVIIQYLKNIREIMRKEIHIHTNVNKVIIFLLKYPLPFVSFFWLTFDNRVPCNKLVFCTLAINFSFIVFCFLGDMIISITKFFKRTIDVVSELITKIEQIQNDSKKEDKNIDHHYPVS
jgi:hypothetical protein